MLPVIVGYVHIENCRSVLASALLSDESAEKTLKVLIVLSPQAVNIRHSDLRFYRGDWIARGFSRAELMNYH